MSTRAIRDALDAFYALAESDYRGASPRDLAAIAAARAEVEAIERAATDLADNGSMWAKDESMDLIQAIAEQD